MEQLLGMTARRWWRLLRENNFDIKPSYSNRVLVLTYICCLNSIYSRKEARLYQDQIEKVKVESPLFILGHWRCGTTLLHDLMTKDNQFAYPTIFQTSKPLTFLTREDNAYKRFMKVGPIKRQMDNVVFTAMSPGEDEFALSALSLRSPLVGWSFPKREAYYDRFLSFRQANPEELQAWKNAFLYFLKKLTYKYKRPLILKSPTHTARIRIILELFPDARFVHIRRNPFIVFRSTQRLFLNTISRGYLQDAPSSEIVNSGIIRRFVDMYEAYYEQVNLIPKEHLYEVKFEELEMDKVNQVSQIYGGLKIPGLEDALPELTAYANSLSDYKKNKHSPLDGLLKKQIVQAWQPYFDLWGYPTEEPQYG